MAREIHHFINRLTAGNTVAMTHSIENVIVDRNRTCMGLSLLLSKLAATEFH